MSVVRTLLPCPDGVPGDLGDGGQVGQRGVGGAQVVELAPRVSLQLLKGQASRSTAAVLEEEILGVGGREEEGGREGGGES